MGYRTGYRKSQDHRPPKIVRGERHRCAVCEELFDSPTLSVRVGRGRAHLLCAALSRVGLRQLARTSGRW